MTDIFSEIEQDIRRERANKLWEKYGIYLIGLAVAIIVVAAAVIGYRAWQTAKAGAASSAYDVVIAATAKQKPEEAAAALEAFANTTTSGYAALARFREAGFLLTAGNKQGAVAALDKISADKAVSPAFQGLARVKAGMLVIDTATYEDMRGRLAMLDDDSNGWRNNARELLGLAAYKAGKYAEAQTEFTAIITDNSASAGLRDRAHVMQALIAPHVPLPVVVQPAAAAVKTETPPKPATDTKAE
ncbi:MAG: tetratricopeptide repeat protein [Parvibaculaceae bacterium]